MRVIYEISLEDIRGILAEKYDINPEKIEFRGNGDLMFARIDVSETETPGQNLKVGSKAEEDLPNEEKFRYNRITDALLEKYIKAGRTIPQICKVYKLTDSKYSAKLYKRAEKFRSEGASRERRSNQEKTQKPEQGADGAGMEVLPVPGMP